jgi:hypothetical protein
VASAFQSGGDRSQCPRDVTQLVERHLHRRPHVEQHAVAVQPPVGRTPGLHATDAVEARREHALGLGQRGEPAGRVTHRREIAHLGQRHEALVGRVLAGDTGAGGLDDRAIEDAETHAAGELADHRIPQLGRHDESVKRLVELVAQ